MVEAPIAPLDENPPTPAVPVVPALLARAYQLSVESTTLTALSAEPHIPDEARRQLLQSAQLTRTALKGILMAITIALKGGPSAEEEG